LLPRWRIFLFSEENAHFAVSIRLLVDMFSRPRNQLDWALDAVDQVAEQIKSEFGLNDNLPLPFVEKACRK
jgi:hypothetical protein